MGWSSARRGIACRGVGYGRTEMETLPLAIANGWGCGISAYAVVLITGLVGRSGVADTPEALQRTDVLVAAAVLLAIEFVADKIPYVDSAWDSVHTVVRPAIGGVIGALLAGDASTLGKRWPAPAPAAWRWPATSPRAAYAWRSTPRPSPSPTWSPA